MRQARVRTGGQADLAGVAAVHLATRRSAYAGLLPADVLTAMSTTDLQRWWEQRLRSAPSPHRLLVASSEGQERDVLGFAHVGPSEGGPGGGDSDKGELYAIHVRPDLQGEGLGVRLLDAACGALQDDLGYVRALLWVLDGNVSAQAFYRRHGWQLVDQLHRTEYIEGVAVTELAYLRRLGGN
jgi:ribosomal protein S18 acetylase RimI-like enzyme